MNLGQRIKQRREALGWGQQELCDKVPGLTQGNLSALEVRGSKTSEFAIRIADALGVSVRWLLDGAGKPDERDWPFDQVARLRWDACTEREKGFVESAMNTALAQCEEARRAKHQGSMTTTARIYKMPMRKNLSTLNSLGSAACQVNPIAKHWGIDWGIF